MHSKTCNSFGPKHVVQILKHCIFIVFKSVLKKSNVKAMAKAIPMMYIKNKAC